MRSGGLQRPDQMVAVVVFGSSHPDGDGPVQQVDVSPFEAEQLAPTKPAERGEQDEGRYCGVTSAASAATCAKVGSGRSSAGSTPAPLIVHG